MKKILPIVFVFFILFGVLVFNVYAENETTVSFEITVPDSFIPGKANTPEDSVWTNEKGEIISVVTAENIYDEIYVDWDEYEYNEEDLNYQDIYGVILSSVKISAATEYPTETFDGKKGYVTCFTGVDRINGEKICGETYFFSTDEYIYSLCLLCKGDSMSVDAIAVADSFTFEGEVLVWEDYHDDYYDDYDYRTIGMGIIVLAVVFTLIIGLMPVVIIVVLVLKHNKKEKQMKSEL